MTNPNDAAFSNATDYAGNPTVGYGLTKREEFAKAAMQGLIASDHEVNWNAKQIATFAVEQADALIAELNKEPSK